MDPAGRGSVLMCQAGHNMSAGDGQNQGNIVADDLVERDANVFLHHAGSTPCLQGIRKAEGVWLEDFSGRRFMDFHGNSVHHLGYGNTRLIEAIKAQLDDLSFTPRRFTGAPAVELAEHLTSIWPGSPGRVLFATGGSDAIEIALKIARVTTGRHKTISFYGSYHGNGYGALSLGWRTKDRARIGPLLDGTIHIRPFYGRADEVGKASTDDEVWARLCFAEIKAVFEAEKIAALFSEPIRSTPHIPPAWFWPKVRTLCDQYGALLVFDEIPTGLGKTGQMFTSEHFDVIPDITVLGKALGGGILPIAATIVRADIEGNPALPIGHYTHEKNPVTARAALTTLQIIAEDGLVEQARYLGENYLVRLKEMAASHSAICQVRGIGLLMTLEFSNAKNTGRDPGELAEAVVARALTEGLNITATEGRGITLSPPLIVTEAELNAALEILDNTLAAELKHGC